MSQHQGKEFRPDKPSDFRWSVLDGEFPPDGSFPDVETLAEIGKSSKFLKDPEAQKRIYISGLFIYALETCNPGVFDNPEDLKIVGQEISQAVLTCMYLQRNILEKDLKAITEDIDPQAIPIIQAFRLIKETSGMSHETQRILDATVRALHIRQTKINQE